MKESSVVFKLADLDRYAIIKEPCTVLVKNNSKLDFEKLYTQDEHPRWILNLKAITQYNLTLLQALCAENITLTYEDIGHLLMTGAIWEGQIKNSMELPVKGEELIAVFDNVNGIIRCTSITVIPRTQPKLYLYSTDAMADIEEFEKIIREMNGK